MGIYDREYYREQTRGSGWLTGATPACKAILVVNITLFLLPRFLHNEDEIGRWFAAYSDLIFQKGQVWRLITATFLHSQDNVWHIVGNMLFLWFIGREVEAFYGTRDFWWLYLSAGAVSTLCWAIFDYSTDPGRAMIGASGAIMAVVSLYTFYNPRREVILFIFPIEMRYLLAIYVINDFLQMINQPHGVVAFAAHLGGFGYAVAFKGFDLRLARLQALFVRRPKLRIVSADSPRDKPTGRGASPSWSPEPGSATRSSPTVVVTQEQLDAQVDEILVKIAREGRASLSDDERGTLDEASRRARTRRSERI